MGKVDDSFIQRWNKKIKSKLRNQKLRNSFMSFMLIFLVIGTLCAAGAMFVSLNVSSTIQKNNTELIYYYEEGNLVSDIRSKNVAEFPAIEQYVYYICIIISILAIPSALAFSILGASFLFYKVKLNEPLNILSNAVNKIADNNLDFTLNYDVNDELGTLVGSFNKMKSSLEQSKRESWHQIEERKKLNAAFSHDLRTPLTVLKGSIDLLLKYYPAGKISEGKLMTTIHSMKSQVTRLEKYTLQMSISQKLEDIQVVAQEINTQEFIEYLEKTAGILAKEKNIEFSFRNLINEKTILIDQQLFLRVYDNLLGNAVRYATSKITIKLELLDPWLELKVSDDGPGFSSEFLEKTNEDMFYKNENDNELHFGLGLIICKFICEAYNGRLELQNDDVGATATAYFKIRSE